MVKAGLAPALAVLAMLLTGLPAAAADSAQAVAKSKAALRPVPQFAPVAEGPRQGLWSGGVPAINKQQSGINTYHRLLAGPAVDEITVHLRFEGVVADDAVVRFQGLGGAVLRPAGQPAVLRLKPGVASEVRLNLMAPVGPSYLSVNTSQKGRGASLAVLLEPVHRRERARVETASPR